MTLPDIVGMGEIAERLGVQARTVRTWRVRGRLPAPDWMISSTPVWRWVTIRRWAQDTGRMPADDESVGTPPK